MTDFILIKCFKVDPDDETTKRKAETIVACFLATFDIYTDVNTVYTLYTSQEDNLCSYNCPAVLATTLCAFIVYSMVSQAKFVYYSYDKNKLYAFLSLFGYGPIVIAMDMWDDIGTNDKKFRKFFRIRWMETTQEALPAAAIQIVVLLFFSTSLANAQDVTTIIEWRHLQSTILIFLSIILSLWSVGNGTRRYCAFIGRRNKPIWYYYCLALYTATDMFNRSLVLSLFFISLLDVTNFDIYMIVVVVSVVLHQILFHVVDEQRMEYCKVIKKQTVKPGYGKGTDNGCFGTFVKKNIFIFAVFIMLYMILPSSVVFLRNFHVEGAKISLWVIWMNGIGYICAGILFFVLRVLFNNKLNALYLGGVIYLCSFNLLPYVLVLYGRLKQRSRREMLEMPRNEKQLTITMEQMNMTPEEEQLYDKEAEKGKFTSSEQELTKMDAHKSKLQRVKQEEERLAQLKAEEIRRKDEVKTKRILEQKEKVKREREQKKRERELKDKAIRDKKRAEDEKIKLEFERKEKEKAKRLEQIAQRKHTGGGENEYDKAYDPRNDDDMASNFSDFVVSSKKNTGKHKKTMSEIEEKKELKSKMNELINDLEIPKHARKAMKKLPKDTQILMINQYKNMEENKEENKEEMWGNKRKSMSKEINTNKRKSVSKNNEKISKEMNTNANKRKSVSKKEKISIHTKRKSESSKHNEKGLMSGAKRKSKSGKHKKTATLSEIDTIIENKEKTEYKPISNASPMSDDENNPKWSLFGAAKKTRKNTNETKNIFDEDNNTKIRASSMDENNNKKNSKNNKKNKNKNKNKKTKHQKTMSVTMGDIEVINENKEKEYEQIPSPSTTPIHDKPKWSLFGSAKKPKHEDNKPVGNKNKKKNKASSDVLRESAMQKRQEILKSKTKTKKKKNRANSDVLRDSAMEEREKELNSDKNEKKLKLENKSVSVKEKKKRKKKKRSSSMTPMTKKEKEEKLKKIQKMKLKNVSSVANNEQKQKKKTNT